MGNSGVATEANPEGSSERCLNIFSNPVNISSCNITSLDPHYIVANQHVTSLDMSFNQMFDFPPDGSPFLFHPNLRYYYCKFCGITAIYEMTFSKLNQLELLNLRGNRIKTIPMTAFNYNRINYLYLAYNQIQTFNEYHELETMQHLMKMDLSWNEGFQLHNLTMNFNVLERLICQRCGLTFLSGNWFEQVKRLRRLNLENNFIKEVPKVCFSKNSKLNYINLSENQIKSLDIVSDNLEILICNNCSIQEVREDSFKEIPNLKVLKLNQNQIANVDQSAFNSNKFLSHLSLDHNNLTNFPYNVLRKLQSLESLCLDFNPFTLQEDMRRFKHLYMAMNLRKDCSAGNNHLYHFEHILPDAAPAGTILYMKDFPKCQESVNISFQNVAFINPMSFRKCSEFTTLLMDNNGNYTFPKHRPFLYSEYLKSYSCCHCAIVVLYPETFSKLPSLQSIILRHNKIYQITTLDIFTSLQYLQFVDLTYNHLDLLPVQLLSTHRSIEIIYLSNNQELWNRWNLPILEQPSVTTLHARNCGIDHITESTFHFMPALEELYISNNPIEMIHPRAFEKNSKLRILHLISSHLRFIPFEAIEPMVQLKRFCFHGSDSYEIEGNQFRENNARLGALFRKRKLHCAENATFMERFTELSRTVDGISENRSAKLEVRAVLIGVIICHLISELELRLFEIDGYLILRH